MDGTHVCVIVSSGVECWGSNLIGQLGNNSTVNNSSIPVQVANLTGGVQAITGGNQFSCAVVNGAAWCWGSNDSGVLGDGTTTNRSAPVPVVGLSSGVQAVAADATHACALVNGGVQCWGYNGQGELGDNSTLSSSVPVPVSGLTGGVQAITADCALVNGGVQCWGLNDYGQLGNPAAGFMSAVPVPVTGLSSGVQAIAEGGDFNCALVNGGVQCWGDNNYGAIGNGTTTGTQPTPFAVPGLTSGVQSIATGGLHTCALVNGGVQCWGYNDWGNLGDNSLESSLVPVAVSGLTAGVQAIAAGGDVTCALVNGNVFCWGENLDGQVGNPTANGAANPLAVPVTGLAGGTQSVSGGLEDSCALVAGSVQCWGVDSTFVLGSGAQGIDRSTPVLVQGLRSGAQAIAEGADSSHACAVVNGGLQCWGTDLDGVLGNNSIMDSPAPVQVSGLTHGGQQLAGGYQFTCGIVNGGVWCWGDNFDGELGNGTTTASLVPVPVSKLTSGVVAIGAGTSSACALVNGGVQCWGYNLDGQLGNNSTVSSSVPVAVTGLTTGVQAIGAGRDQTCAIVNGGVWCWGSGFSQSSVPVQVPGLTSGAQIVVAGFLHACALVNGGVLCWGTDGNGDLGDNSFGFGSAAPVQVEGLTGGVRSIAAGDRHTCALLGDGSVMCWGNNVYGELGDNTTGGSPVPVLVSPWQTR